MYHLFLWLERWPQDLALLLARLSAASFLFVWAREHGEGFGTLLRAVSRAGIKPELAQDILEKGGLGLAVMLVAGFGARFAALAGLILLGWIHFSVNDAAWQLHLAFAATMAVVLTRGAARFSLDYMLIRQRR